MSSADARSAISYPTRCASTSPPTGCITRGLMVKSLFTKILGSRFKRELKRLRPVVDGILRHEERLKALSDAEIQAQTPKLRAAIAQRTTALVAEVERLKREKHDCPDAGQRAALSDQLARAEAAARCPASGQSCFSRFSRSTSATSAVVRCAIAARSFGVCAWISASESALSRSSWRRIPSTTGRSRFSSRLNRLPRIFVNRLLTISPLVIQPVGGEVLAHRVGYEIA